MIGAIGTDTSGQSIMEALYRSGVDIEHVLKCPGVPTGVASIAVTESGENNVLVSRGANNRLMPNQFPTHIRELSPNLVILQLEIPVETARHLIRQASAENIPVLLNAAPALNLPREIFHHIEHLIVNMVEAEDLLGRGHLKEDADRETAMASGRELCKDLLNLGAKNVVVTMASFGGVAGAKRRGNGPLIVEYEAADTGDGTGCGGVFIGAYAVEYIRQKAMHGDSGEFGIERAVRWAAKAAAPTATHYGSLDGIPWEADIDPA
ncbi:putative ribokinase [Exophiala xenobiotica]|nr:putative ribokinase [Exophiala xenobiotica]